MAKRKKERPASIGHNSSVNDADVRSLKGYVSEIVRLEEQKRAIAADISEIYKSAKEREFDTAALRQVVKVKLMDGEKRAAHDARERAADAYKLALGMLVGTPLADAAIKAAGYDAADAPRTAAE